MTKDRELSSSMPEMEIINPDIKRGRVSFAIFDFDGTISLIREGWQDIMIPMMVEILMETPDHERRQEIEELVKNFVTDTTGKQTIYQMIRLVEEIEKRGGEARDPLAYKHQYHQRLMEHIADRRRGLREGKILVQEMVVPGSLEALEDITSRGVTCFLASGTDQKYVLEEAELLGVKKYFEEIYGALDAYEDYSKKMVIERIIREHDLDGPELVAFGDGYVEIENTKAAHGIAVGVASNESEREGMDKWKRSRLIASGADIIIPDFRSYSQVRRYLQIKE